MLLYILNVLAALLMLLGFHLAFRQERVRAWTARLRPARAGSDGGAQGSAAAEDREEIASVFRLVGVMIMAMSFTSAAFADLIAYFRSATVG
jgi:hypothetical protein